LLIATKGEPVTTPSTCSSCGFEPHPDLPRAATRPLISVVDEFGASTVCGLCAVGLLARLGGSGDVTVLVARPHTTATV
jgi:hypothetical protein